MGELKRIDISENGDLTLEGRVVSPARFWKPVNIKIESEFLSDKVVDEYVGEFYNAPKGANSYLSSEIKDTTTTSEKREYDFVWKPGGTQKSRIYSPHNVKVYFVPIIFLEIK